MLPVCLTTADLSARYATMVLAFLLVYFGVRSYRDTVVVGTVGFGRRAGDSVVASLAATDALRT